MRFGKKQSPQDRIEFRDVSRLDEELEKGDTDLESSAFTTGLSPQEVYLLARSGYRPFQVVVGSIVYSMGLGGVVRSFIRAFSRGEMVDFSHLQRVARELAVARMRSRAAEIGACGVVSIRFESIQYADFLEVVAIGTSVKKCEPGSHPFIPLGPDSPELAVGI